MKTFKSFILTITIISLTLSADIPKIDIYIESLCPFCMNFITNSYKNFLANPNNQELANVKIVAYGNAKETWDGSKWVFQCQHGPNECYGNAIITCAQSKLDQYSANQFIICLDENIQTKDFNAATRKCLSAELAASVMSCADSDEGNRLLHEAAQNTPKHNYVPWIVYNGEHVDDIQQQLMFDMLGFLCRGRSDVEGCRGTGSKNIR
jgi:interferon gamma-inducible protein 30